VRPIMTDTAKKIPTLRSFSRDGRVMTEEQSVSLVCDSRE